MANLNPENTLRFAWWAGEEQGLLGSADYVAGLLQAERDRIALYMNYDMVGSPNYIFMVYDADESTFPRRPACRSRRGRRRSRTSTSRTTPRSVSRTTTPSSPAAATTRRSSWPASRPAASSPEPRRVKTEEQEAIWGGTAGEQYDPCYHVECDTIENID